jgi:hypothetical protein
MVKVWQIDEAVINQVEEDQEVSNQLIIESRGSERVKSK